MNFVFYGVMLSIEVGDVLYIEISHGLTITIRM